MRHPETSKCSNLKKKKRLLGAAISVLIHIPEKTNKLYSSDKSALIIIKHRNLHKQTSLNSKTLSKILLYQNC